MMNEEEAVSQKRQLRFNEKAFGLYKPECLR